MAVDDELIEHNPSRKVQPFPEEIPDVHILTFEEEFKYLALAGETLKSVAIIMLGQGMRPDEVFPMTYENLDFANRVTILQRILGHSEIGMTMRYVKIAEHYKVEAVERLEKYRAEKMQEVEKKMGLPQ